MIQGDQRKLTSTSIQITHDLKANHQKSDRRNVPTGADHNGESHRIGGRSKHITVHLFPAVLIAQIPIHIVHLLIPIVSSIIFAQCSHQNHGDQPDQKDDHHKGVEDGEPVDSVLKEVRVEILVETILK